MTMKLSNEIADITGGTSGIELEAVKKRCIDDQAAAPDWMGGI